MTNNSRIGTQIVNTDYIVPALFINECFVLCCLSVDWDALCYTLRQKSAKDANSMHQVCIFSVLLILCMWGQNIKTLDYRECCAHCATYSCLGNINHFILTAIFSYCENLCSEISNTQGEWVVLVTPIMPKKALYCYSTQIFAESELSVASGEVE